EIKEVHGRFLVIKKYAYHPFFHKRLLQNIDTLFARPLHRTRTMEESRKKEAFGMNYVTSVALWGLTTDEMVEAVERGQMDGIIWSYEQLKQLHDRPERMKRQHESSSLRFALDGPSDLNLCAVNETIRRHSMKEAKRAIEWARTLGVDWLR